MKQQIRVALHLACGYTKKEIANMLGKSYHTINQETRLIYQKTDSLNSADITCCMVTLVTGIDVRTILQDAIISNPDFKTLPKITHHDFNQMNSTGKILFKTL